MFYAYFMFSDTLAVVQEYIWVILCTGTIKSKAHTCITTEAKCYADYSLIMVLNNFTTKDYHFYNGIHILLYQCARIHRQKI